MNFKEFTQKRGISESQLKDMTPENIGKLHNDFLEEMQKDINEQLDKAIDKNQAIEIVKNQLEDLSNNDVVKEMNERILQLQEKTEENNTAKKGYFVEFVEKQIKENDIAKEGKYSAITQIKAKDLLTINKAAELMTTANVKPNVTNGFNQLFGNYIDNTIYEAPKPDTFILPLVDVEVVPGTESIWYVERVNEEGDAEFIGEGDAKPLADGEWQERKADIKEVALFWKMSKRLTQSAPSVVSNFRTHANELVDQKIDDGIYEGDGTGDNLTGIATSGVPFVVPTQLANYYEQANIYDVIMAVATKVRLTNFKGQLTAILNTVWKAKMQGIKDTDGQYIIPPFVTPDGNTVGEVRVVFTNKANEDEITLGVLNNFKVRISQNIEYYEGYENDDFRKNLMSKKLEAFMGTYIPTTLSGSIITDDISTILTAIEVTP